MHGYIFYIKYYAVSYPWKRKKEDTAFYRKVSKDYPDEGRETRDQ